MEWNLLFVIYVLRNLIFPIAFYFNGHVGVCTHVFAHVCLSYVSCRHTSDMWKFLLYQCLHIIAFLNHYVCWNLYFFLLPVFFLLQINYNVHEYELVMNLISIIFYIRHSFGTWRGFVWYYSVFWVREQMAYMIRWPIVMLYVDLNIEYFQLTLVMNYF